MHLYDVLCDEGRVRFRLSKGKREDLELRWERVTDAWARLFGDKAFGIRFTLRPAAVAVW